MLGELTALEGSVRRNPHLRIGHYHQHLSELFDPKLSSLEFMLKAFPDPKTGNREEPELMRRMIGRFGITGPTQTLPIGALSDGQKSRLALAWLAYQKPHILLLDEPTNHLDMDTIDSLAEAINGWEGGMVLVSHDFRLIEQVADEIWVCGPKIEKWGGDIRGYKDSLLAAVMAEEDERE